MNKMNKLNQLFRTMAIMTAFLFLLATRQGFAADGQSTFIRLQFGNDASIEVPRHWTFLDQNIRQHLNTASEAVAKFAGIDVNQGNNQILVAANAYTTNKKPSATIRLSVRVGVFPSQAEIKNADSNELRREVEKSLKILQGSLPENVKDMKLLDVRLERLGNYYTIVSDKQIEYTSGTALDRLDVIYVGNKAFKLNTSYRKSEAWIFEPVIRHIRQSLKINSSEVASDEDKTDILERLQNLVNDPAQAREMRKKIKNASKEELTKYLKLNKILEKEINLIASSLPLKIDKYTTVDSAGISGNNVGIKSTLSNDLAGIEDKNKVMAGMYNMLKNNFCTSPAGAWLILGYTWSYFYYREDGTYLGGVILDAKTCDFE